MSHSVLGRRNIKMNKTWLLSSGYVHPGSLACLSTDSAGAVRKDEFQSRPSWTISRSVVRANTLWDKCHPPSAFSHLRLLTPTAGLEEMDSGPHRMLLLSRGRALMGVNSRLGFSGGACGGGPRNRQTRLCTFGSLIPEAGWPGRVSHAEAEFGIALFQVV